MIARPQLPHQGGGDRGHARCGGPRRFGAFEQGHALFEHGDGRIAEAAVLKALILAGKPPFRDFGAVIDKALAPGRWDVGVSSLPAVG